MAKVKRKANAGKAQSLKLHVKKGDTVRVLSGRDRGKTGRVMKIVSVKNQYNGSVQKRAIVEGINMVTKHEKPNQNNPKGEIVRTEAAIHISNLMFVDPKTGEGTRIGRKRNEQGSWSRYSKKSGELIG